MEFLFPKEKRTLSPELKKLSLAKKELYKFLKDNNYHFQFENGSYFIKGIKHDNTNDLFCKYTWYGKTKLDAFINFCTNNSHYLKNNLSAKKQYNLLSLPYEDSLLIAYIFPYQPIQDLSLKHHYPMITCLNKEEECMLWYYFKQYKPRYLPNKYHNIYIKQVNKRASYLI